MALPLTYGLGAAVRADRAADDLGAAGERRPLAVGDRVGDAEHDAPDRERHRRRAVRVGRRELGVRRRARPPRGARDLDRAAARDRRARADGWRGARRSARSARGGLVAMSPAFRRKPVVRCDAGGGHDRWMAIEERLPTKHRREILLSTPTGIAGLASRQHGVVARSQLRGSASGAARSITASPTGGSIRSTTASTPSATRSCRAPAHGWPPSWPPGPCRPEPSRRGGALGHPADETLHARRHRTAPRRSSRDERAPDRAPTGRGDPPPRIR